MLLKALRGLIFLVLALVLVSSMPTIAIPHIDDESKRKRDELADRLPQFRPFSSAPGNIAPIEPYSFLMQTYLDRFNVKNLGGLKNTIRLNEGVRHNVYLDSRKNPTVGVGFNLSRKDAGEKFRQANIDVVELVANKVPLSNTQIENLFDLSLIDALNDVRNVIKDFDSLSSGRQIALADMMFQLGKPRFLKFERMIKHVNNKNWPKAAEQLLDSKLALKQTPDRAHRNAEMILGVGLKRNIKEEFVNPGNPEQILPHFDPFASGLFVPEDVEKVPVPKVQKKFDEELRKRLNVLPLGDLGRMALSEELITEAGLTIVSRKDLIELIFRNITLVARTKEL